MANSTIPSLQTASITTQESSLLIAAQSNIPNPSPPANASGGNQDLGLVFDAASREWVVTAQQVQQLYVTPVSRGASYSPQFRDLEEIYKGCIQARDDLLET